VWQLHTPDGTYKELQNSTISSFLKFIAQRYKAPPVKKGIMRSLCRMHNVPLQSYEKQSNRTKLSE
jgi:hypothetical protein